VSFAGDWAAEANRFGRLVALSVMTVFGLAMVWPTFATRLMSPAVSLGSGLSQWADQRTAQRGTTALSSLVLGAATGLVWAPCAGPILGVILAGAALRGPSAETSTLLLVYGLGAATSLGPGMTFGGTSGTLVSTTTLPLTTGRISVSVALCAA